MNLWRRRPFVLATVAAIGLTLAFPAMAIELLGRLSRSVETVRSRAELRVFLATGSDAEADRVGAVLRAVPGVLDVRRVRAAEGREALARRFPELADVVRELSEEDLALPDTLEATLAGGGRAAQAAATALEGDPAVEAVSHDEDWSRTLERLATGLRTARAVIGILGLAVAAFGIGNVIRINALSRREELAIMRLVGAPRYHLRVPFALEGAVQGALGGLLAAGLVGAALWIVGPHVERILPATPHEPVLLLPRLVLASTAAGLLGAAVAVEGVLRRHARLER